MARTTRRNKKHLIQRHCGTREENVKDPWFVMWRYPTLTFEQAYARTRARLHRDHRSGRFGVPNWFRRQHGVFKVRHKEKHAIHRHLRDDSWDNHLPDNRVRGAGWYWW